ncbi:MAG: AzlC family ABC transporter permease [Sulfitobacter sp.]|jgi:predicted branched-subunit amino acid permease|nr:AzlC family ABC transporter permease [Sulfitobacter sp.]
MAITTTKSAFRKGLADAAPFVLVIIPFSSLFGILATEAGLSVFETLAFSVVVIAGAAQFTALQLMQEHAPTAIVLASALAVNLRMAMYSASLTPYIGAAPLWQRAFAAYLTVDQSYVCSMAQYEKEPDMTIPQRMSYFFGCVTPIVPLWYLFTLVGAVLGTQIPDSWALDFALPITFLAMIAPMFRTPAHVVAALVASVAALATAAVPYSLGLILAGLAGMIAGAQTEVWQVRRAERTAG